MGMNFPNESGEYRAAREKLLAKEIELRRLMEAVAEERRALPPGPLVGKDYVFDGLSADGKPARIRFSELFSPGRDTLILYNMMFPRYPTDPRPKPAEGAFASLPHEDSPCPSCTALVNQWDGAAPHLEAWAGRLRHWLGRFGGHAGPGGDDGPSASAGEEEP